MTDMIKTEGAIIKTDEAGRVRTPAVRREQLLDEFERSGLSGQKFAELAGIKYQTFASWAQKRRRARGLAGPVASKPGEATRWLEAVVESAKGSGVMVLELPGGARLEVADEKQAVLAAVLVKALARPC